MSLSELSHASASMASTADAAAPTADAATAPTADEAIERHLKRRRISYFESWFFRSTDDENKLVLQLIDKVVEKMDAVFDAFVANAKIDCNRSRSAVRALPAIEEYFHFWRQNIAVNTLFYSDNIYDCTEAAALAVEHFMKNLEAFSKTNRTAEVLASNFCDSLLECFKIPAPQSSV